MLRGFGKCVMKVACEENVLERNDNNRPVALYQNGDIWNI